MFSKILVPLDGTAESNAALRLARTVANASGGAITLLRVVQPHDRTSSASVADDLRRIAAELGESAPSVEHVVTEADDVAKEILAQVQSRSTDLVIMRTHGRAGISRAVLGSVSEQVLAGSQVPVMLMRPGGRRISRIGKVLVPIDGTPGGTLALGTAVQISRTTGARIKLLQVSVPVPAWAYAGDAYGGMAYYDPAWDAETTASARTYIDAMVSRLHADNVEVEGEARQDALIPDAIVAAAEAAEADLIVMSTRALTGPARTLLGSTANAVVRLAHCPVLLIHRREESETVPTAPVE